MMFMFIKQSLRILNVILLAIAFFFLLFTFIIEGPHAVLEISLPTLVFAMILFFLSFVEITISERRKYLVHGVPGATVMKTLRMVYSRETLEDVFEPVHRDFLDEYADAISDYLLADDVDQQRRAGFEVMGICCRYYFAFFRAILNQNFFMTSIRSFYRFILGT